jgi:hypothetical protein
MKSRKNEAGRALWQYQHFDKSTQIQCRQLFHAFEKNSKITFFSKSIGFTTVSRISQTSVGYQWNMLKKC